MSHQGPSTGAHALHGLQGHCTRQANAEITSLTNKLCALMIIIEPSEKDELDDVLVVGISVVTDE